VIRPLLRFTHVIVKSQKIESFCPFGEVYDPGFLGVQSQPECGQSRFGDCTCSFGSIFRRTEDYPIICIPDVLSRLRSRPC
jgi:hypothetical protein